MVVAGHSAGALVALELHRLAPARVSALALVAPAVPAGPGPGFASPRPPDFGQALRLAATRGLLANDTWGLRYMRRQILRQRDEVASGVVRAHGGGGGGRGGGTVTPEAIEGYLRPLRVSSFPRFLPTPCPARTARLTCGGGMSILAHLLTGL